MLGGFKCIRIEPRGLGGVSCENRDRMRTADWNGRFSGVQYLSDEERAPSFVTQLLQNERSERQT